MLKLLSKAAYFAFACLMWILPDVKAQINNPCGVIATIYPLAKDSVVPANTIMNFSSVSTNANSFKWYLDEFLMTENSALNYQVRPGLKEPFLNRLYLSGLVLSGLTEVR